MKVYHNGAIVTMEDDMPQAEVLIEEDGKILYVGAKEGAPAAEDAEWIDLEGKTMMPAMIDGHGHFSNTAMFLKTAFLQDAESFDDIVRILTEFKEAHAGENLKQIVGMGYDHNFLKEQAHPTKDVLDRVSTDVPVVIMHTSMHMGAVNSKLLEMANMTADSPDIPGGVIVRDPETNEPMGPLEELAMHGVLPLVMEIFMTSDEDLEKAQDLYIKNGVLTVQEGAAAALNIDQARKLAAAGKLKCDLVSYPCISSDMALRDTVAANKDCLNHYVDHFKIGGYKIVLDGSPQCKTAWLSKPYEGEETYCGYPWLEDEKVQECVDASLDDQVQLLCHCNGDASGDQFLDAYEKSVARFPEDAPQHALRPVMIHCQTAREDQLDRMAKLHMIASIFVDHVSLWGDVHLKNLGQERGNRISPVKSAMDRGICVNFHTDAPVVMPDCFHSVWSAVNRVTRNGVLLGADQRVDVWDALKAVTINAAYSYFDEDIKGSLKAGKMADLIIIDKNPLDIDPMAIKDIKVLTSIKEGEVLYQAE